jgi:hypothetical protein
VGASVEGGLAVVVVVVLIPLNISTTELAIGAGAGEGSDCGCWIWICTGTVPGCCGGTLLGMGADDPERARDSGELEAGCAAC